MDYKNYEQVKFVSEKIKENEKLLDDLKAAEEVRIQLASGYHIKTIQCGMKAEKDYALDHFAIQFKKDVIATITHSIESLKKELSTL